MPAKLSEDEAKVRFESHTERQGRCKVWIGSKVGGGYGSFRTGQRFVGTQRAHRVAWIWQKGPIPDDMELDHMCKNRACVLVGHLRRVPKGWNLKQGAQTIRDKPRLTHCKRGHERVHGNLYYDKTGTACKKCKDMTSSKLYYFRKKERANNERAQVCS